MTTITSPDGQHEITVKYVERPRAEGSTWVYTDVHLVREEGDKMIGYVLLAEGAYNAANWGGARIKSNVGSFEAAVQEIVTNALDEMPHLRSLVRPVQES